MTPTPLDLPTLARRLRERDRLFVRLPGFRESAVLVPIVVEPGGSERLLFTVRDAALRSHAGQIAFPGGARDTGDSDLIATALRETTEELGIAPGAATVLGLLDDVPTPSGFVITPVVALVEGPVALAPARGEVSATFLAEIAALRDPARHSDDGEREFLGVRYLMHEYRWLDFRIWGATARIVHQLLGLLDLRDA